MQSGCGQWKKTVTGNRLVQEIGDWKRRLRRKCGGPPVFVCIGTDRSTGDAFGPLTGMLLVEAGFPHVIGTLGSPCDSSNLPERLLQVPQDSAVLAIDASVGSSAHIGRFSLSDGPVRPGRSLGKPLPPVGCCSITGIVCENRANPYSALQSSSLFLVMGMARQLAAALSEVFGEAYDFG